MSAESTLLNDMLAQLRTLNQTVGEMGRCIAANTESLKWVRSKVEDTNNKVGQYGATQADCRKEMEGRVEALESWRHEIRGGWKTLCIVSAVVGFLAGLFGSRVVAGFLGG